MRRKRLDGLLLHLGNALVTLALLFGGLEAFLSAHAYGYSRGELLAVCALASVLAVGLYAWRHGGWAVLGLLAALTLARDPLWEKLLEPAADMFRSAGTRRAGLPLLILTAGVLALLLGWLVVRARCWYLCALVVTLPVLPPIMEGVLPEWTALLLSAAGWGTLLLTASFQGTAASGGPSCSVWPAWGSFWPSSPPPCPGRGICAPTGPPTPGTSWCPPLPAGSAACWTGTSRPGT